MEWQQQEYTVMESDAAANGIVSIIYPSGGSSSSVERRLTYQDQSASGGVKKMLHKLFTSYCSNVFWLHVGLDYANMMLVNTLPPGLSGIVTDMVQTPITDDNVVELTESFNATVELQPGEQLSLSNASILTATFVILDDDGKHPQLANTVEPLIKDSL